MLNPDSIIDAKYQVVRELGRGGMGAVFEARHTGTGRRVALKVIIREALAANDREVIARFQTEARASGAIDSQHVVQVLDTGVDPQSGSPYLVMEYLAGEDLQHVLRRLGPLSPDLALRVIAQACAGLSRAHGEGIVHRDIKSANLYLARREEGDLVVKLLDFGIAKVRADPMGLASGNMTRTGAMLGSPFYMSPEQVVGKKEIDGRSDVYSLGVTLFEALVGRTPFQNVDTIGALVLAICSGKGEPIRQAAPHLPANISAIIERATAIEPDARFATAADMRTAILALLPEGAALHERMLAAGSHAPRLAQTAPLIPSSTPAEVQSAAGRLLRGATTPLGALTPPPQAAPAQTSGGMQQSNHGFGGTNPAPNKGAPLLYLIAGLVGFLALAAGIGLFVKYRSHGDVAAAPSASHSTVAAQTSPIPVPTPVESVVAPAVSSIAVVEPTPPPPASSAPPPKLVAVPGPRPAPPPAPATAAGPGAKPNCNPNFYIDKNGAHHFKEECL